MHDKTLLKKVNDFPGPSQDVTAREILVSDIPAGDEKIDNPFLPWTYNKLRQRTSTPSVCLPPYREALQNKYVEENLGKILTGD
jgi:hypothetical protein